MPDISNQLFTHIIGFTAPSVVPNMVMPIMEVALSTAFTRCLDPWQTIVELATSSPWLLSTTPIIVFQNGKAKQLVYSAPPFKPWGITPTCTQCDGIVKAYVDGKGSVSENHGRFKFKCTSRTCKYARTLPRPEWLEPLDNRHYFSHKYPLNTEELAALGQF